MRPLVAFAAKGRFRFAIGHRSDALKIHRETLPIQSRWMRRIFQESGGIRQAMLIEADDRAQEFLTGRSGAPAIGMSDFGDQAADVQSL